MALRYPLQALPGRLVAQMRLRTDRRDAPAPRLEQVGRGLVGRQYVVDGDTIGEPVRLPLAQEDDGHVTGTVGQFLRSEGPGADDRPSTRRPPAPSRSRCSASGSPNVWSMTTVQERSWAAWTMRLASSPKYGE